MFEAVFGVFVKRRRALILLVAANAANGFILFLDIVVAVSNVNCSGFASSSFPLFDLSTSAPARSEWVLGCDGVLWRLGGKRSSGCRLLG